VEETCGVPLKAFDGPLSSSQNTAIAVSPQ